MSLSPKRKTTKSKFLLDENVDIRLAPFLKRKGFSVLITPKGLKNGAVAALAKKERAVFLTNDKDFANSDLFKPSEYAGMIIFFIHPPTLPKLTKALDGLLSAIPSTEFVGKMFLLFDKTIEVKE